MSETTSMTTDTLESLKAAGFTDEMVNTLKEEAEKKINDKREAARAQAMANEFDTKLNIILNDPKIEFMKERLEKAAKETTLRGFGGAGVEELLRQLNKEMTLESEMKKKIEGQTSMQATTDVVNNRPESVGGIPMTSGGVIDFTQIDDKDVDPKVLKDVQRIRKIQMDRKKTVNPFNERGERVAW